MDTKFVLRRTDWAQAYMAHRSGKRVYVRNPANAMQFDAYDCADRARLQNEDVVEVPEEVFRNIRGR